MGQKLLVYHYPRCGTCRKAIKWLEERGHELELQDIAKQPPAAEHLAKLVKNSGLELKKFFNTSGQVYREQNLKEKLPNLSEDEQIKLLASNGMLIKRPIVTDGKTATVGFKEDHFEQVWGQA